MIAIHVRVMKVLAVVSAWLSLLGCAPVAMAGTQSAPPQAACGIGLLR